MMHNDLDTSPSFAQSLEFFQALRRNGKEVYFLSYRGEGHGLRKYENRLDWDTRVGQFLDYCLKGATRPNWMQEASVDD